MRATTEELSPTRINEILEFAGLTQFDVTLINFIAKLHQDSSQIELKSTQILFDAGHSIELINEELCPPENFRFVKTNKGSTVHAVLDINEISKQSPEEIIKIINIFIKDLTNKISNIISFIPFLDIIKKDSGKLKIYIKTIGESLNIFLNMYPNLVALYQDNKTQIDKNPKAARIISLVKIEKNLIEFLSLNDSINNTTNTKRFTSENLEQIKAAVTSFL